MAKYELPIYGEDNELVKTFETDIIKFNVLIKIMELNEKMADMKEIEKVKAVAKMVSLAFPNCSEKDALNADKDDLFNTFYQINRISEGINKGSKNA